MPPAVVAVVGAVATIAVKVFVKSKIIAALLILAINVAAFVLTRRPVGRTNQGQEIRLKLDPTMPRQIPLGRTATGGSVVWAFTYGSSNGIPGGRWLVRIVALSDIPIQGLVAIKDGKETLTFSGDVTTGLRTCTNKYKSDGGAQLMSCRVYKGSYPGVSDSDLQTWSGGAWTANHRGAGMAYAVLRYEYDIDGNAFPGGEPQLIFIVDGVKCYDDRKDSTKPGGSGAHRLNDISTWEFTNNTGIHIAQSLRGFYSNGVLIYGAEAEERDLSTSMLFSAFNTCDENVTYSGGTQKRYESGMMVNSEEALANFLVELQAAMDGRIIDRGGAITILPGAIRTPVFNLTDDDIIPYAEKSWQPKATLSELYNHVAGVYIDPDTSYNPKGYPPLRNAQWETDDGNERFTLNVSYSAVTDWARVQRITKRIHQQSRYQGTVAFMLPLWGMEMEQGDWFTLTSDRFGFTNKYFEAMTVDLTADLRVAIVGRETSSTIDGWNYAVDEKPRGDTYWNPPTIEMPDVTASALGIKKTDVSGVESFGVKLTITGFDNGTNMFTHLQVQISPQTGNTPITDLGNITPINQDAEFYGLLPSTAYAIRVRGTDGTQYGPWTTWKNFTTPAASYGIDATLVPTATIYANSSGVVKPGQLPKIFAPAVKQGSTNIKLQNNVSYAVAFTNATGSVDNTNGSTSKGDITLSTVTAANAEIRLTISVDGVALPVLKVVITRVDDPPPPPGSKLVTFTSFNEINSTSYQQLVVNLGTVTVASGESLYGTGTLEYQASYTGAIEPGRYMTVKWQRSPTGVGTWTDFAVGGPDTGSTSTKGGLVEIAPGEWDYQEPVSGSVVCVQSSTTPGAATYDVRAVATINSSANSATIDVIAGTLQCEAKV